jgi:hypothetical protein
MILSSCAAHTRAFSGVLQGSAAPVKFIAFADLGVWQAPASYSTAALVTNDVFNGYDSFLLHFGDISYAMAAGFQWDVYMHLVQGFATSCPYMVSIGNRM